MIHEEMTLDQSDEIIFDKFFILQLSLLDKFPKRLISRSVEFLKTCLIWDIR